jgi:putative nucleotidyltransferase with HDIG domain
MSSQSEVPGAASGVMDVFPALAQIEDERLRFAVARQWDRALDASSWERYDDVVMNPKLAAPAGAEPRLVQHVNFVTESCLAVAPVLERWYGVDLDRDLLIAGCLLHDLSKMLEYESRNGDVVVGDDAALLPHPAAGAALAMADGFDAKVIHMIWSHTHQNSAVPAFPEALLLHYVDYLDADLLRHRYGQPMYCARGAK